MYEQDPNSKSTLRQLYLKKRKALDFEQKTVWDKVLCKAAIQLIQTTRARTIHCYQSLKATSEVDTQLICTYASSNNHQLVVPKVVSKQGVMEGVYIDGDTTLQTGSYGILEPVEFRYVNPLSIDLFIVPLLVADTQGHRVGYGGGFYDRYLSRSRPDAYRVGLSYFEPIERILDSTAYDQLLDVLITPERTYYLSDKMSV